MLHANEVDVQRNRMQPGLEHAGAFLVGQLEEVPLVGQVRKVVRVDSAVKVLDVCLKLVAHLLERRGKGAHLVTATIVELHVVVCGRKSLRRGGKPKEWPRNKVHAHQGQRSNNRGNEQRHGRDGANEPHRRGVYLGHGCHHQELHAIGQRSKRHLPLLAFGIVANELASVVLLLEHLVVYG